MQLLEEAGYRTVQDLAREDADRLAIRTGLGIKKARQIQVGASHFLSTEGPRNRRSAQARDRRVGRRRCGCCGSTCYLGRSLKGVKGEMLRTCAGCREVGDPNLQPLVRVVLGPSGEAVPDLAGSGFGRGAWVHPRAACLAQALPRGFSKSMKHAVHTSVAEFSSALRAQAERRAYSLVGAAFRARKAAAGSTAVRDAHAAGLVKLVLVACDARAAAETPLGRRPGEERKSTRLRLERAARARDRAPGNGALSRFWTMELLLRSCTRWMLQSSGR